MVIGVQFRKKGQEKRKWRLQDENGILIIEKIFKKNDKIEITLPFNGKSGSTFSLWFLFLLSIQGRAKVSGHLDFEAFIGLICTFLLIIHILQVNTFILAYCKPKLTKIDQKLQFLDQPIFTQNSTVRHPRLFAIFRDLYFWHSDTQSWTKKAQNTSK